jgi:hypothetical protein
VDDLVWPLFDLAVREADEAKAGEERTLVASSIRLEVEHLRVAEPTVHLHDEAV